MTAFLMSIYLLKSTIHERGLGMKLQKALQADSQVPGFIQALSTCKYLGVVKSFLASITDSSNDEDEQNDLSLIMKAPGSLQNQWRKGYGSKMMDVVLHDIAAAGYSKVMLWVFEDNARARRFYEAHGFTTSGKAKPNI